MLETVSKIISKNSWQNPVSSDNTRSCPKVDDKRQNSNQNTTSLNCALAVNTCIFSS